MSLEGGEVFSLRTPPLLPRSSSWQRELRRPKRFSAAACVGAKLNAFFWSSISREIFGGFRMR